MKLLTSLIAIWIMGAVIYAGMLLFPFSKTWNCAIGVGLLTNAGFLAFILYMAWENNKLYNQAVEATERYIKLTEQIMAAGKEESEKKNG